MKKLIVVLATVWGLVSSFAQNNINPKSQSESLFNANELSAQIGMNYTDAVASKFNPSLGIGYYLTENFGIRGTTVINAEEFTAFNNGELVALARLPLLKFFSPYIGGGTRYVSLRENKWSAEVLGGVEGRINKKWGVFIESNYDWASERINFNNWNVRGD